jgi:hypothetical protein
MSADRSWRDIVILSSLIIGSIVIILIFGVHHIFNRSESASKPNESISSLGIRNSSESTAAANRIPPDQAVINHYGFLQKKQLHESWTDLSTSFQGSNSKGFSEYKNWWDSVESIYVDAVKIIVVSPGNENAVVKADLRYKLRTGRVIIDQKKYIYLVWDNDKWLINEKSEVYTNTSR